MPFATVRLKGGVNTLLSPILNEAGYQASQLGRFKGGLFQKIGGWVNYISSVVTGISRCLHAWEDLNQNGWLGVATTNTLDVIENATTPVNISPQTFTTNTLPNFSTVMNTNVVTIVDSNLPAQPTILDMITLLTPVSVGGLILVGQYQIIGLLSSTSYTIAAAANAASTVNNGGAVPLYTTTSGSPVVTVTLNAHGLTSTSQTYVDPVGTTVGGITILGGYGISSITDANDFVIAANSQATSSTSGSMNGGDVLTIYGITLGAIAATGSPYGFGTYGSGPYGGLGGAGGTVLTGSAIAAASWTLDNWGQDLVACPINGSIYYWSPTGALINATPIPTAPLYNTGIFVSAQFQILVAYGSTPVPAGNIGFQQDPLFVRWSDQGNFLNWTATPIDQAGGQRLYSGSKIIAGYGGPTVDLLWTDLDLWTMTYLGSQFVYGFNKIGENCGIVGPHAFAPLSGQVYWLGQSNCFIWGSGGVSVLPCTVWDTIFQDFDQGNAFKAYVVTYTGFDEVIFRWPSISGGTGECDKEARYNTTSREWSVGYLQRSAGIDQSVLGNPIEASRYGNIYLQETGYDGAGTALSPYMQTGFFELGEGQEFVFVDRVYPDMRWGTIAGPQTATVLITLYSQIYAGDTPTAHGPFTVTQATEFIPVRIRGRFMSMKVASQDMGSFWRLEGIKYRYSPDGRR